MAYDLSRRSALRGLVNGAAVVVGVPLLDAFLDGNGAALAATGGALPVRFGTWFWGLGVNPPRWYPTKPGANYDIPPELAPITPLRARSTSTATSTSRSTAPPTCPTSAAARRYAPGAR